MEGFSPASSSVSNQKQMVIGAECWLSTEQITQEILSAVQPSLVSEQRRMGVIHYVQRLIRSTYGTEAVLNTVYRNPVISPPKPLSLKLFSSSQFIKGASRPPLRPINTSCLLVLNAEQNTREILCVIQPTVVSEQRRMEIIDYVQRLYRHHYGTEVLPLGSVPLKTYLPDGDIDLTVLGGQINEERMARDICNILEGEERRGTRSLVRGVQYIPAQVKIVKCFVDHISVDISFNQMAGRCTLCFLEQVNQLIGKDHLFKRSILLIKAWCYYESRTLGAHHGLISTYALDVMILYIINMFHSTMETPLAVLYKFLDYYRTFEWERYCVTIYGRVAIPSLPNIVVEKEESSECGLLLTKEFLENCVQYFSIPSTATANREQFPVKFMNIMDPLKSSNNLGRSVNRANFYRIKSALNLGARTLKQIFMGPAESMAAELRKFFGCTLDRNLGGERPNEQFNFPVFGDVGRRAISNLGRNYGKIHGPYYSQVNRLYSLPVPPQPRPYISHPFARNPTPCLQYRWTDLSQTMMNEFIPREIGHRNALQLLSSSFGVQQFFTGRLVPNLWNIMALRASGAYIPNMGAGSSNLRGTGTFIPTVREQVVPQGTSTGMPDMGALNLGSTRNYSTHMGADERLKCQGTSTSICEMAMEGMANWQGPGTSIADTNYIDADSWDYKKKRVVEWVEIDLKEAQNEYESCFDLSKEEFSFLSSSNRALASESGPSGMDNEGCSHSVRPTTETEKADPPEGSQSVQPQMAEPEDKAGSSGSFFKLSLDEFPLLPSRKKAVAPPTSEPVWPATAAQPSEVAQNSSPHHLGALRHSPPPPRPSSPATKESDSGVSTPVDPILGFPTDAAPGPQLEPSDCNEEAVVAKRYQLEDEMDFPPLRPM